MPKVLIDGVRIHYEVHGEGTPLVWSHEFAGDHRSWRHQVAFFSRGYRVVTYNARGYPPSDVPTDPDAYSQELAVEDLRGLLEHLSIESAHVGGLSMGWQRGPPLRPHLSSNGAVSDSGRDRDRLYRHRVLPVGGVNELAQRMQSRRNGGNGRLRARTHPSAATAEGPSGVAEVRGPVFPAL